MEALRPVYTFLPRLRSRPNQSQVPIIVPMVTERLTGRMGSRPILPVNHWHNVKTLTVTGTGPECVNTPLK